MINDEQYTAWILEYGSNRGILGAFIPSTSDLRDSKYISILENIFKDDPELAYGYADAIGERFELGEPAIATSAKYAYYYTISILNNSPNLNSRWEEAEKIIASSPCWGWYYSLFVLESRFPEYEENIQKSSEKNSYYIRYMELWPNWKE